jgi:putative addiction module component (TIGR02574 family)
MTPAETEEVRDLRERALKLPPDVREQLALEMLGSVRASEEDSAQAREALRAELQRRMDAVAAGTMKTYSVEETMAYLRQVVAEGNGR